MDANALLKSVDIRPQAGPQEEFLLSSADICIYGGAAGGGKTWGLLLDPLRDVDVSGFMALIFRRTYPEITNAGGLWDESEKLYQDAGGKPTRGDLLWRFRSGARVEFSHLQHEKNLTNFDGAQITLLAFDQLEHFTEKMFWYLQIRNRSMCGVPPRLRATCNPDPDSWLITGPDGWGTGFLSWWIGDDGYALMERSGVIRWMVRYKEQLYWDTDRARLVERFREIDPDVSPISVTYIPATVYDNKLLLENDKSYLPKLKALPLVERERFLGDATRGGNWKVRPEAGKVFDRSWFEVVDHVPDGGVDARGWDFAATLKEINKDDPDFTASVKMRMCADGFVYVTDVIQERMVEIDEFVRQVSAADASIAKAQGCRYRIRWETEPASAGIRETARLKRLLVGMDADGVSAAGDKLVKWRNFAAFCQTGKVRVLAATWTDRYLAHLHGQPDQDHDDLADGSRIAYDSFEGVALTKETKQKNPWMGSGRKKRHGL